MHFTRVLFVVKLDSFIMLEVKGGQGFMSYIFWSFVVLFANSCSASYVIGEYGLNQLF